MATGPEDRRVENTPVTAPRPEAAELIYVLLFPLLMIAAAAGFVILLSSAAGLKADYWQKQILLAASVAAGSAVLGSLAIVITWRRWPDFLPQGVLAAVAIRLIATLAIVMILVMTLKILRRPFYLATACFYIIGLISETILAIRTVRQCFPDSSADPRINKDTRQAEENRTGFTPKSEKE
jgi:hypothetical protein